MIDASELSRGFSVAVDAPHDAQMTRHDAVDDAAMLRVEVGLLREQLDREREFNRQLSSLLGEEREERRKLTAMLTHQPESMPRQAAPEPRRERKLATWVPAGILLAMLAYVAYTVIVKREAIMLAPAEGPTPPAPPAAPDQREDWKPDNGG